MDTLDLIRCYLDENGVKYKPTYTHFIVIKRKQKEMNQIVMWTIGKNVYGTIPAYGNDTAIMIVDLVKPDSLEEMLKWVSKEINRVE